MSESLFNPGFLGSGFLWWIGQIVDDSTWRENINPEKFEKVTDIPAWGYRYKVKIMGYHDQSEAAIKAEQLPWAQVMFPITAGGGAGCPDGCQLAGSRRDQQMAQQQPSPTRTVWWY